VGEVLTSQQSCSRRGVDGPTVRSARTDIRLKSVDRSVGEEIERPVRVKEISNGKNAVELFRRGHVERREECRDTMNKRTSAASSKNSRLNCLAVGKS